MVVDTMVTRVWLPREHPQVASDRNVLRKSFE